MARLIPPLVASLAQAENHIHQYERQLTRSVPLRERASYARAWYASQRPDGKWVFAPSKFVGYDYATAENYLKDAGRAAQRDGRQTERVLEQWFEVVPAHTRRGRELMEALQAFLAKFGQMPNSRARINVLRDELRDGGSATRLRSHQTEDILDRISADPRICGGRPCIKGTRMRVSDIIDLLTHGASREEILQDFPYLVEKDITAALHYASQAVDHRVIQMV
jgi:uncharacterized protein (DUF433 family)